jgi:hypothetical protein
VATRLAFHVLHDVTKQNRSRSRTWKQRFTVVEEFKSEYGARDPHCDPSRPLPCARTRSLARRPRTSNLARWAMRRAIKRGRILRGEKPANLSVRQP